MTSHSSIVAKLDERHAKQKIEIVDTFPLLNEVSTDVILGSFSWYWMQEKKKAISRRFHLNFNGVITTPSEVARTYLELKYKKLRTTGEQARAFKIYRTAPLYAQPHTCEEGIYIDIRSAYWQILQIIGWDVDYNPSRWLGRGEQMHDFPYADIKLSRNCLITAGLPTDATFWKGQKQKFEKLPTSNRLTNLGVWAAVMDILHGAARDCIKAGAFYAHTDGYICSIGRQDAVLGALASWGLEGRIKRVGPCTVYGVGCYTFGGQSTKNPKQSHPYDNVTICDYHDWLKRKVKFFSERTEFLWQSTFTPTPERNIQPLNISPLQEK